MTPYVWVKHEAKILSFFLIYFCPCCPKCVGISNQTNGRMREPTHCVQIELRLFKCFDPHCSWSQSDWARSLRNVFVSQFIHTQARTSHFLGQAPFTKSEPSFHFVKCWIGLQESFGIPKRSTEIEHNEKLLGQVCIFMTSLRKETANSHELTAWLCLLQPTAAMRLSHDKIVPHSFAKKKKNHGRGGMTIWS